MRLFTMRCIELRFDGMVVLSKPVAMLVRLSFSLSVCRFTSCKRYYAASLFLLSLRLIQDFNPLPVHPSLLQCLHNCILLRALNHDLLDGILRTTA